MNGKAIDMRDFQELEGRDFALMSISMKCSCASYLYDSRLAAEMQLKDVSAPFLNTK
jgi:hypothetical protein